MKKITILFFGALFLIGTSAVAQLDKVEADQKAQQLLNRYQADLELTIEQVNDFHQTISSYLIKRDAVKNKAQAPDARKSALSALSKEETTKMASILNPHQLKLYKKLKPKIQPL